MHVHCMMQSNSISHKHIYYKCKYFLKILSSHDFQNQCNQFNEIKMWHMRLGCRSTLFVIHAAIMVTNTILSTSVSLDHLPLVYWLGLVDTKYYVKNKPNQQIQTMQHLGLLYALIPNCNNHTYITIFMLIFF